MTTTYVDFEQVKSQYPIEQVAERLGLELKKATNGQLRGPCFSGAEGDRKLVVTPSKGLFYSFALNEGGDVIKLVSLVKNIPAKEAAAWIAGTEPEKKQRSERTSSREEKPSEGFSPLPYVQHDHQAVEAIGLDAATAERLGVGFCPKGIYRGRVAWPIRTDDGIIRGYIACEDVQLPPDWKL